MKSKTPELLVSVPDGPIQYAELSWAKWWINIFDNGCIGYQGSVKPTETQKEDIRNRILRQKELLKKREQEFDRAWNLMQ